MRTLASCLIFLTILKQLVAFTPNPLRAPLNCRNHQFGRATIQLQSQVVANAVEQEDGVITLSATTTSPTSTTTEEEEKTPKYRPLHQNWFPVSITTALNSDRPNAIELLGEKLVLYRDDYSGKTGANNDHGESWKCLADRCSHRFAPLSEGRLVVHSKDDVDLKKSDSGTKGGGGCASCTIQCAYHGWEFNSEGKCTRVPQYNSSSKKELDERKASSVPSYPVRVEAGMVWVWSDPDESSWEMAHSIPLPISPLVRESYKKFGAEACFMRDLPYGMELLGENLLDLSHLPFSHHGVGKLQRKMGGELPLRVMGGQERVDYARWEEEFDGTSTGHDGNNYAVPLYQVEILNATQNDPMFLSIAAMLPNGVSPDANGTIAFFEPCHVRYRRERVSGTFGHVELFMSPTSAGKSRVFLWNTIRRPPPAAPSGEKQSLKSRLASLSPLSAIKKRAIAILMNPASARAHTISHLIFDGDGIFLHKQGNRMQSSGQTFRQYSTPTSSDVLLNSYRRYLDAAAKLSIERSGSSAAAESVSFIGSAYRDDMPRSVMLDRYESHTKHCSVCSAELARCEKRKGFYETAEVSFAGAGGASAVALLISLASNAVPRSIVRAAAVGTVASVLGSFGVSKRKRSAEKKIQSFLFEDYVHAEKE